MLYIMVNGNIETTLISVYILQNESISHIVYDRVIRWYTECTALASEFQREMFYS